MPDLSGGLASRKVPFGELRCPESQRCQSVVPQRKHRVWKEKALAVSSEHLVATAPLGGANADSVRFVQLSAVRNPS